MAKHNKNTSIAASQKNTYVRAWCLHVVLISCFYLHIRVETASVYCCRYISVPKQAVIVVRLSCFHTWPCVVLAMPFLYLAFLSNKFVLILTSYTSDRFATCHQISSWFNFETFIFTGWLLLIRYCFSTLRLSFSDLFLCIYSCNGLFVSWLTSFFSGRSARNMLI